MTSFINSRAVLRGATIPWDQGRLIEGKFKKYQKIGGEPLTLTTRTGDRISAFHFEVGNFHRQVEKMGGKFVDLEIGMNHPFFERAQPVTLSTPHSNRSEAAVRIPYSPELESEFKNPKEFLAFCKANGMKVFWENSMQPFEVASWWHFNSMKQNLILVSSHDVKNLKIDSNPKDIQVEAADDFDWGNALFKSPTARTPAIVFEGNHEQATELFAREGLKFENSKWSMISHDGKLYLVESTKATNLIDASERLNGVISFKMTTRPLETPNLDADRGTVVLSMNQTNSFASYSHEVLTFLLSGSNVLAYDNAGKGLSEGRNSQEGITEAVRTAGKYLIDEKKVGEHQIMFKGQCSGGLPSSEAAKLFPTAHVWVDQSPNSFSSAAAGIAEKRAQAASEEKEGGWLKTFSGAIIRAKPVIEGVTSLALPSYNVVDNLKQNFGVQIYTIGVPDERGYGGDDLVPLEDRDRIETHLRRNQMGYFIPMTGATHVTDWWVDLSVAQNVDSIFQRFSLSVPVFPQPPKTAQEAVERSYESFTQKPYDAATASEKEASIHQAFEAVSNQDFEGFERIVNWGSGNPFLADDLKEVLSGQDYQRFMTDAVSLSRQLGNKAFTEKLLIAQRKHTF